MSQSLFKKGGSTACVAVGCSMRRGTNLMSKVRFFYFPKNPSRRMKWILAVNRKNWMPSKYSRLCNKHFITGQPSTNPLHQDYVPSVFSHTSSVTKEPSIIRLKTVSILRTQDEKEISPPLSLFSEKNPSSGMEDNLITSNFDCVFCKKSFPTNFSLKRHLKNVHAYEHESIKEGEIFKEFIDFTEFLIWKEQEERKTSSMYVQHSGSVTRKNGDKIFHYYCNRSGLYKPKGKGLKRLKGQGSAKIGRICPAKMMVKVTSKKVIVHFFQKHEKHEMDVEHLRLHQSDREAIAGRLKESVSESRILDDIRNGIMIDSGRKMLIKKRDIQNIKRDFNINSFISRHHNDAESVRLQVEEMEKGKDNCVIYFKEQGKEESDSSHISQADSAQKESSCATQTDLTMGELFLLEAKANLYDSEKIVSSSIPQRLKNSKKVCGSRVTILKLCKSHSESETDTASENEFSVFQKNNDLIKKELS